MREVDAEGYFPPSPSLSFVGKKNRINQRIDSEFHLETQVDGGARRDERRDGNSKEQVLPLRLRRRVREKFLLGLGVLRDDFHPSCDPQRLLHMILKLLGGSAGACTPVDEYESNVSDCATGSCLVMCELIVRVDCAGGGSAT
jgi:hypothetical protein